MAEGCGQRARSSSCRRVLCRCCDRSLSISVVVRARMASIWPSKKPARPSFRVFVFRSLSLSETPTHSILPVLSSIFFSCRVPCAFGCTQVPRRQLRSIERTFYTPLATPCSRCSTLSNAAAPLGTIGAPRARAASLSSRPCRRAGIAAPVASHWCAFVLLVRAGCAFYVCHWCPHTTSPFLHRLTNSGVGGAARRGGHARRAAKAGARAQGEGGGRLRALLQGHAEDARPPRGE